MRLPGENRSVDVWDRSRVSATVSVCPAQWGKCDVAPLIRGALLSHIVLVMRMHSFFALLLPGVAALVAPSREFVCGVTAQRPFRTFLQATDTG